MRRKKMGRKRSKRDFSNKSGSHPINTRMKPMRGGWRL